MRPRPSTEEYVPNRTGLGITVVSATRYYRLVPSLKRKSVYPLQRCGLYVLELER